MVRDSKLCATRTSVRLRFGFGRSIYGEDGFHRIMRDYSRSPTGYDLEFCSVVRKSSQQQRHYSQSRSQQYHGVQPRLRVSLCPTQQLGSDDVSREYTSLDGLPGRWLTVSHHRTCTRLGPRRCQPLVGRILSSAMVLSSHKPKPIPTEIPSRHRHKALHHGRRTYIPPATRK